MLTLWSTAPVVRLLGRGGEQAGVRDGKIHRPRRGGSNAILAGMLSRCAVVTVGGLSRESPDELRTRPRLRFQRCSAAVATTAQKARSPANMPIIGQLTRIASSDALQASALQERAGFDYVRLGGELSSRWSSIAVKTWALRQAGKKSAGSARNA